MIIILLHLLFSLYRAQLCNSNGKNLFPLDITNVSRTVFENVNIYSNPPPHNSSNNSIDIEIHIGNKILSFISESYGTITLDRNIDFLYGDKDSKFEYSCKNISLVSPSINLFWGNQQTISEIIIECVLVNKSDLIGGAVFKDDLVLTFPVVQFNISDTDSNKFIYDFISNVKNVDNIDLFTYKVKNFSFESHFLYIDDLNQESQFYFLNGNNPLNCNTDNEVTFIFYNDFIKISNTIKSQLQEIIEQLNLKSDVIDYYASKNNNSYNSIVFYRNFYYNEFINEFEQMLMNTTVITNLNNGIYILNSFTLCYIILIICFV